MDAFLDVPPPSLCTYWDEEADSYSRHFFFRRKNCQIICYHPNTVQIYVYESHGLDPNSTQYVEAHGTGTKAGDPIETEAIYRVLGKEASKDRKLWIGSVKPNIGHLEAAAGVAGIIKGILSLQHGLIPPNVLFSKPNPAIPLDEWNIGVPTKLTPWPVAHIKRMSISGFGMGGTNGHVVLDAFDSSLLANGNAKLNGFTPPRENPQQDTPFASSAAMTRPASSAMLMRSWNIWTPLAQQRRAPRARLSLSWRATCLAESATELREYLTTKPGDGATRDSSSSTSHPRIGFVFTGQGAQWARMGVEMLERPIFRDSVARSANFLRDMGCLWDPVRELSKAQDDSRLSQPEVSQPISSVLQIALVDELRSWGGDTFHSGRTFQRQDWEWPRRGSGLMRPIFDERKVFAPTAEGRDGLPQRAYEQVFGSYSASIADIEPLHGQDGYGNDDSEPAPIMVSNSRAILLGSEPGLAGAILRCGQRAFAPADTDADPNHDRNNSIDLLIEIGPHSALGGPVEQILSHHSIKNVGLELAAEPFVAGIPLCLSQVNGDKNARQLTDLPPYQWNHSKAFRHETRIQRELVTRRFPTKNIIGALVPMMDESQHVWRNFIRLADEPWIGGHMVGGTVLFPAAGLISMALEAAQQLPQLALGTARHEHRPADGPESATSPEPIYDTGPAQII
ncbi:hypothetical protein V1506DRAFT_524904 [Lipomyces tetrasporus]